MTKTKQSYLMKKKKNCKHENAEIVIVKSIVTCETIVYYCADCDTIYNEKEEC